MDPPTPIAIVGIGCRFSGVANSPEKLWELLASGKSTWSPIPADRWNNPAFFVADAEQQGMHNIRGGHFLEHDVAAFDAGWWGIAPAECEAMDPQHRIQLEVAYEALENAGIVREEIEGSDTAVFVATFTADYKSMQQKDLDDVPKYHTVGIGTGIAANRISYQLDLRGPSVTLDTGCSGSLVAIHQACQSLRTGESRMALAGGVNLMLSPDQVITMSLMRCFSEEGKCYSFDSRGTGYGRGEGAAMVVLKRLDDAIHDGDSIRAIIRNSGVNQDGKTKGIMVPSSAAQRSLIESVYQQVRLEPMDTPFVEAHGTGTAVGDPLEVAAIQEAFRNQEKPNSPLYLGSVKSNIGHLESASGIAGLIKGVLMLEHGKIPATIGIESLKANLRLDEFGIEIPDNLVDWPSETVRRLSLNSFGYGGTNAHAILEAAPEVRHSKLHNGVSTAISNEVPNGIHEVTNGIHEEVKDGINDGKAIRPYEQKSLQILVLSAESADSLARLGQNMGHWASNQSLYTGMLEDLAFTLTSRRSHMRYRIAFPVRSLEDFVSELAVISKSPKRSPTRPQIVFVFTGQGAQWYSMGRALISIKSSFRASLQRSNDILRSLGTTWSLIEELSRTQDGSRINESELAQCTTCAIQIALVDLLEELEVEPHKVLGHSSGEIAAAYAAGAIDQASALAIAWFRGQCTQNAAKNGTMLAVGLGEAGCVPYLERATSGRAVIACANSPASSTISGDRDAVADIEASLKADGIFARRLVVETAYHSQHMLEVADQYHQRMKDISSGAPHKAIFFSSVTGEPISTTLAPQYWVDNLVSKVRFEDATRRAIQWDAAREPSPSQHVIIEIGPHNALAGPIRQTLASIGTDVKYSYHAPFLRGRDALATFATLATELFERGCLINLQLFNTMLKPWTQPKVLTTLPSYPWDHSKQYWHESRLSTDHRFRRYPYHDLLGIQIPGQSGPRPVWRHILSVARLPWLKEHFIDEEILFPATGYIAMVLEAMRQITSNRTSPKIQTKYELRDIVFAAPLVVPDSNAQVELQLQLIPVAGSIWDDFRIQSFGPDGTGTEHCYGSVMAAIDVSVDDVEGSREMEFNQASSLENFRLVKLLSLRSMDVATFYQSLKTRGNVYGKHFACLEELEVNTEQALSRFRVPDVSECMPAATMRPHLIHPTIADALFHPSVALANSGSTRQAAVTASIRSFKISSSVHNASGTIFDSCTRLTDAWAQSSTTDIDVFQFGSTGDSEPVIQIQGLRLQNLGTSDTSTSAAPQEISYLMKWGLDVDYVTSMDIDPYSADPDEVSMAQAHKLHKLNQASALYIDKCLTKLAQTQTLVIKDNYQRLVMWMHRFRASRDYANLLPQVLPTHETAGVLNESRTLGVEGEVLANIGENMIAIISGKVDPLSLFMERDLLWRLYADDASVRCYGFAIEFLRHLVFKNPNMAVLEIGAGTGGATEPILEALSSDSKFPFHSYDFTDVSTGFFERSQSRLQKWNSHITYRKLDLQDDPISQGFGKQSYDLVIASNVLHVAHSIDTALSRIRTLLKPGGRVLMIETTRTIPFMNTAIGVLPGWWGAEDGRIDGPLLSEAQWDSALARNGLGGNSVVSQDFEGPAHRCAMIVSKPLVSPEVSQEPDLPLEILLSPCWEGKNVAIMHELVASFKAEGRTVTSVPLETVSPSAEKTYILLDNGTSPVLTSKDPQVFQSITNLASSPISLLWVGIQEERSSIKNPEKGLVTGFARVARLENKSLQFLTLDVQDTLATEPSRTAFVEVMHTLAQRMRTSRQEQSMIEPDCVFKNGQLYVPRVIADKGLNQSIAKSAGTAASELQTFHQDGHPLRLSLNKARIIDDIEFEVDSSLQGQILPDHIEVIVQAFGINFKDVLIAGGHNKKKLEMAGEFAGIVTEVGAQLNGAFERGDRVCGFGATPYASRVRVQGETVAKLPASLSMTAGASIPVVFATAYHALVDIARLRKGQTVLIHSAAGGVGQAAISIARWVGAEIFATVGNASKKDFLTETFGIPAGNIFSSRLRTFKDGIKRLTVGQGVDVVLNSLSGQMLQDSLSCVSRFGTFVELGKTDIHQGVRIPMEAFDLSITMASVDLSMVHQHKPAKSGQLIRQAVALISDGQLRKPTLTVAPLENLGTAFRTLQHRTHIGKIVLDAGEHATVLATPRETKVTMPSDATFIVAGGRSGIGLEIGKNLVSRGAKHIVLLSRRAVSSEEESKVSDMFQDREVEVRILSCDITNKESIRTVLLGALQTMPPVRGVIQSTLVLRNRLITKMDSVDFAACTAPKTEGTQNLLQALGTHPLQLFVMLSSVVGGALGSFGEANYAAANTYLNYLANTDSNSNIRFVAVCPGIVEDAGVLAGDEQRMKLLQRQGFLNMTVGDVIALVNYSLSDEAIRNGSNEIVSGFNHQSLARNQRLDKNPLFSHLPLTTTTSLGNSPGKVSEVINIVNASTQGEAELVISQAIAKRLQTLVAHNEDDIDTSRRVGDLGVDSLVLVELKNWISHTFQVRVQNNEIYDSPSIASFAALLAARSPMVASKLGYRTTQPTTEDASNAVDMGNPPDTANKYEDETGLPKQPLPHLDSSLELWLAAVSAVLSDKKYAEAVKLVEEFRKPGGLGRKLHARLAALASDSNVDNWQEDMYNKFHHLKLRAPLVPLQNFASTHNCANIHSPAKRAAIIASACHQFYQQLEDGGIQHQFDRGRKLEKNQYKWFFNTTREPRKGEDAMMKYSGNNYVIAFRRGRMFRIELDVPFTTLMAIFQKVIDSSTHPASWVGILTTDDRDLWAHDRAMLQAVGEKNADWLRAIEAAEFVVYLDDVKPSTARERGHQFLQTGFNRWSDKTVQFAVCDNGYSGTIGEHSMIDGYAARRLNAFIQDALESNIDSDAENECLQESFTVDSFAFTTTPELERRIVAARAELQNRTSVHEFAAFETQAVGADFFRAYKIPAISGVQIAIQLASRKYFGFNPIAHETVGLAHFLKGRVECSHTVWPEVKQFCDVAYDEATQKETVREMFFTAAKIHANNLLRSTQGYGLDRHLLCMEWSVQEGEEMPKFFKSEVYKESRPKMLMTDCLESGVYEAYSLPAYPGGFWVHFETESDRVRFSTWGKVGEMNRWEQYIREGAEIVRKILEG